MEYPRKIVKPKPLKHKKVNRVVKKDDIIKCMNRYGIDFDYDKFEASFNMQERSEKRRSESDQGANHAEVDSSN